jgi:hypothetical protein
LRVVLKQQSELHGRIIPLTNLADNHSPARFRGLQRVCMKGSGEFRATADPQGPLPPACPVGIARLDSLWECLQKALMPAKAEQLLPGALPPSGQHGGQRPRAN